MRNHSFLALGALLLSLSTACFGSEIKGSVTVAFGKIRQVDGTWRDVSGMTFPVTIRPAPASKIERVNPNSFLDVRAPLGFLDLRNQWQLQGASHGPDADVEIYKSDDGFNYGFAENNPSSLDGLTITQLGVDKPWKTLGFVFNYNRAQFRDFLIRWRLYEINTENPAGQSDFVGEFADFGVIWNIPLSGSNYVEIDVSQAGVSAPSQSFFMAQQFRDTSDLINGNGPFEFGVDTVFSPLNPPSIGSSAPEFWFDGGGNTPDGIYENTEIDVFQDQLANHTYRIVISDSSTIQSALPISATTVQGNQVDGDFLSLWFVDNNDYTQTPNYNVNRDTFPSILEIVGQGPSGNMLAIKAGGRTRTSIADVIQKIEFYDYVNQEWVFIQQTEIDNVFVAFNAFYGGTVPLNNFKEASTNRLKARIHFKNTSSNVNRSWTADVDQFIWKITTP